MWIEHDEHSLGKKKNYKRGDLLCIYNFDHRRKYRPNNIKELKSSNTRGKSKVRGDFLNTFVYESSWSRMYHESY